MHVRSHRLALQRLRWGIVAALIAVAAAVGAGPPAAAAEEGTIHSLANQSRASAGLPPLALNGSLNQVALAWAQHMAATGTLAHNPSYASQIPPGWQGAGENVAQGYPSASAVHGGWMASPGHRANILGDFTDIGIAHIAAGGTTWSVQVFAKYARAASAPPTAAKAAPVDPGAAATEPAAPAPPAPEQPAPDRDTSGPDAEASVPAPAEESPSPSEAPAERSDDAAARPGSEHRPSSERGPIADAAPEVEPVAVTGGVALVLALFATMARMLWRPSKWGQTQR